MNPTKHRKGGGRQGPRVLAAFAAVGVLVVGVIGTSLSSILTDSESQTSIADSPESSASLESPEPEATGSPTTLRLSRSTPVTLRVPAIGVNARLLTLSTQKSEDLVELPSPPSRPGWYKESVTPGQQGVSTIIGYIRKSDTQPGVFADLADLEKKDRITVGRKDGKTAVFRVDKIKSYLVKNFPQTKVYQSTGRAELRVITSGGTLRPDDPPKTNVVVYAHLVDTRGQ